MNASCPNKIKGGCIYCKDFSKANITSEVDIIKQYKKTIKHMEKKWPNSKYIIYFQSGTNTFTNYLDYKNVIDYFLQEDLVVGISIATRPDSISDEWFNYLKELNKQTFLKVELGLQTSNDSTLKFINRGHNVDSFINTVKKLKKENINVVAHIINGLPHETKKDMLNTISLLNDLSIDGIKIHALYINKSTPLEKMYLNNEFKLLTKDEYIDIICDQLELLDEKIVIERITGDPDKNDLIEPTWLLKKFVLLNDIDKELKRRNTFQGYKKK
jgi:radical SAM protein (TIGR01212 family)